MFKVLLKSRIMSAFDSISRNSRGNKRKKTTSLAGTVLLFLFVFAALSFSFGTAFGALSKLLEQDFAWLYFSLAFLFSLFLSVIGSIFMTQSQLYDAKDNDLLLSMPILPKYILATRMVSILIFNFIYVLMIAVPAGVIWVLSGDYSVRALFFYIIAVLLTPFISLAISCVIGWIIALISSKVKNKSAITLILFVLFFAAYMYFYFSLNRWITAIIINASSVANKIKSIFPLYHFGKASADGDVLSLLIFAAVAIIPFICVYIILSHSFISIATSKRGAAKIKYKERSLKASSPTFALVKKEATLFFRTPLYVFNSFIGSVFIVIMSALLFFNIDSINLILQEMPQFSKYISPVYILAICFMLAMNTVSAPSVSLEGKNLWIAQSIPVNAGAVLCAKAYNHIMICLPPAVFASVIGVIVLKLSPLAILNTVLTPIVLTVFFAFLGVLINLQFPKFYWVSETAVIKQGMSVLIYMLSSIATLILPFILYIALLKDIFAVDLYILLYTVLILMLSYMLYYYLNNAGVRKFESFQS